jgi:hypothetical protein
MMLPLILSAAVAAQPAGHEAANPLYRELREVGLDVGPGAKAKFPPPIVADGLDAAKQKTAILALVGGDHSWEEFIRPSVVAPSVLRITDVKPSDPQAPARRLTVGFVAHGDFNLTDDEKFLDRLLNSGKEGGGGKTITATDLAKRKITPTGDRERFGHVEFDVLDRVRLEVTGRAVWSKTGESVLVAARIDPRFVGDPEFPDQWRPLARGGKKPAGDPKPYTAAGLYLKVTKLAAPAGAMFVEEHVIFAEPHGWFDGANLLRSKLPPVVQNNVRSMRREWVKASGK